jgi:predicted branched-subunit amino acid permease
MNPSNFWLNLSVLFAMCSIFALSSPLSTKQRLWSVGAAVGMAALGLWLKPNENMGFGMVLGLTLFFLLQQQIVYQKMTTGAIILLSLVLIAVLCNPITVNTSIAGAIGYIACWIATILFLLWGIWQYAVHRWFRSLKSLRRY